MTEVVLPWVALLGVVVVPTRTAMRTVVPTRVTMPRAIPQAAMAAPLSLPAAWLICDRATAPNTMARIDPTKGTTGTSPRTSEAMAIPLNLGGTSWVSDTDPDVLGDAVSD